MNKSIFQNLLPFKSRRNNLSFIERKTKILSIVLFLSSFFCSETVFALDLKISLKQQNVSLEKVLNEIEQKTNYLFVYNDEVDVAQTVSIDVTNSSVTHILELLFDKSGIFYQLQGSHIILSQNKENSKGKIPLQSLRGTIKDVHGESLIAVSVVVKGTAVGTATDFDGNFQITLPEGNTALEISYLGFKTQIIDVQGKSSISVVMQEDTQALDELVVTALGIKRDKKMLGYAMQSIKSDELNKTTDPSVIGALQGKVAGLQMNTSSTGLSGSTKITLRGNSSLTDNNQPLWVVDGVPFSDNNSSSASTFGGVDRGGGAVDINPEDIESISVLKGPNAAALYGSRAGNGVILITTKRGTKSEGFGVSYSGSTTWSQVASTLHMQDKYGQGENGVANPSSAFSYGPLLDKHEYTAWNAQEMPYQKYGNKMRDYFNIGFAHNHNIAIGGVTEKANFRLSVGHSDNKGLFNKEKLSRTNIDLKSGLELNKYLSVDSKLSLSKTKADNRPIFGRSGEVFQLLRIPNNIRLQDLKNFRKGSKGSDRHLNWHGPTPEIHNPYYVNYRTSNVDDRLRAFGYYSLKLDFTSWLYATAKYSFDYHNTEIEDIDRTNGIVSQEQESLNSRQDNFYEHNLEALLFGYNHIGEKFRIGYSLGFNEMFQKTNYLLAKSTDMRVPGVWEHRSAVGANNAEDNKVKRNTRSFFGNLQLAWNDYLSLELTGRRDRSSTLKDPYNYYSASLSYVFSDFIRTLDCNYPSWLTFGKTRLSMAQVGKDTDAYRPDETGYWIQKKGGAVFEHAKIKASPYLLPEISSSYEFGIDMKFFDNRLGFDFTAYHSLTKNQIMNIPIGAGSGYKFKSINAGEITNTGFELMLYSTLYKSKNSEFNLDVNFAHNRSIVKSLDTTAKFLSLNYAGHEGMLVDVGTYEGGKLGEIYALKEYRRDANGAIINRNGFPLSNPTSGEKQSIGSIQPDLLMSVSPSFSYKGLTISTLFDMKFGGSVVAVSEAYATLYGTAKKTEKRGMIIAPGVDELTGETNQIEVDAEKYYRSISGSGGLAEEFVYSGSFIKLKELSLSYSFSKKSLERTPFLSARISLVGRNLAYLLKYTPGTSPEGGFDTTMFSQAIDFTSVPFTRTFGLSVNFSF